MTEVLEPELPAEVSIPFEVDESTPTYAAIAPVALLDALMLKV